MSKEIYINYRTIKHKAGMVTMDNNVDKTTHFAANTASHLYLAARIAVTLAAGIPANTTDTPVTTGSTWNARQNR